MGTPSISSLSSPLGGTKSRMADPEPTASPYTSPLADTESTEGVLLRNEIADGGIGICCPAAPTVSNWIRIESPTATTTVSGISTPVGGGGGWMKTVSETVKAGFVTPLNACGFSPDASPTKDVVDI